MKSNKKERVDYFHLPRPMWRKIKKCLPSYERSKQGGRPPCANRAVMNASWYILWTGCQGKALQRDWFGVSASAVHARCQRCWEQAVFAQVMKRLAKFYQKKRKVKWKWQALDSKSCPAPLGGEGTGGNPTDRAKLGTKRHLLVDKRGAPLSLGATGANRHDKVAAIAVISAIVLERPEKEQHLCADAAYDASNIRDFVTLEGFIPHLKVNARKAKNLMPQDELQALDKTSYPAKRWVVERPLSWLAKRRSIRTRWSKKLANWLALAQLAAAYILFNLAVSG